MRQLRLYLDRSTENNRCEFCSAFIGVEEIISVPVEMTDQSEPHTPTYYS